MVSVPISPYFPYFPALLLKGRRWFADRIAEVIALAGAAGAANTGKKGSEEAEEG
jgi:hypothetical protein